MRAQDARTAMVGAQFHELVAHDEFEDDAVVAESEAHAREVIVAEAQRRSRVILIDGFALCLYTTLVVLLSVIVVLSRKGDLDYYLSSMVREVLLGSEFDTEDFSVAKTFYSINSLDDVYMFLRGPLLAALFVETSYINLPLPPSRMRHVNDHNILLGAIRLQQVRVLADTCEVQSPFGANESQVHIQHCYADWSTLKRDTGVIEGRAPASCSMSGPTAACTRRTYVWSDVSATGLGVVHGRHSSYDGAGYMIQLPVDLSAARTLVQELQVDGFLDLGTRAVWVDFALFNVNINRFCTVRLLFERLASGIVTPSASVRTLHLLWYDGVSRLLAAEIALLCLVVFFVGFELQSMRMQGLRVYWRDASNWYDWPSLLGFGFIAFCRWRTWWAMRSVKHAILLHGVAGTQYLDLHEATLWASYEQTALSVDTLLVYLKVLHFLAGVPHIKTLLHTLVRARIKLAAYIICLAILVLAFASAFNIAFGTKLAEWHSMGAATMSLLRFTLGEVDVQAMHRENPTLAFLLFVSFFFLVVLVAISIFLAIVTDSYAAEKAKSIPVDLPSVIRAAAGRQFHHLQVALRTFVFTLTSRVASGTGFRKQSKKSMEDSTRGSPAVTAGEEDVQDGVEAASKRATQTGKADGAATLDRMAAAREAMEGGHLFILNGVSTQLKSMCFKQDLSILNMFHPEDLFSSTRLFIFFNRFFHLLQLDYSVFIQKINES